MIRDYVCVDIETTGCRSESDKIIEIGAVKVRNGQVVEIFNELIDPGINIPYFITELTGITDEMVKGKDSIKEVLPRFIEFSKDDILMGHNLSFDFGFLKQKATELGLDFEKEGIDTLKIARKVHKDLESRKLDYLCSYYGIKDENHHRAFNDARVTSELYDIFVEKFGEDYKEAFEPAVLEKRVKKVQPATEKQIKYLTSLCNYHNIPIDYDISSLSRSEASRKIDKILSEKGRILY